jgi:hypothetical protein
MGPVVMGGDDDGDNNTDSRMTEDTLDAQGDGDAAVEPEAQGTDVSRAEE